MRTKAALRDHVRDRLRPQDAGSTRLRRRFRALGGQGVPRAAAAFERFVVFDPRPKMATCRDVRLQTNVQATSQSPGAHPALRKHS